MIDILDTARLLYKNAILRAFVYGEETTRQNFFSADGTDLGDTLKTNAQGYIIYGDNSTRANGYFVKSNAIIEVSLDNGVSYPIQWLAVGHDVVVNDGQLLNKAGTKVWSANSADNYKLNYNDLINTPSFSSWSESEQSQDIYASGTQELMVSGTATVLRLTEPVATTTDKTLRLQFIRYAQQLIIINETGGNVTLQSEGMLTAEDYYVETIGTLAAGQTIVGGVVRRTNGIYCFVKTTVPSIASLLPYFAIGDTTALSNVNIAAPTSASWTDMQFTLMMRSTKMYIIVIQYIVTAEIAVAAAGDYMFFDSGIAASSGTFLKSIRRAIPRSYDSTTGRANEICFTDVFMYMPAADVSIKWYIEWQQSNTLCSFLFRNINIQTLNIA